MDDDAAAYVRDVEELAGDAWRPVPRTTRGSSLMWNAHASRVRYRYLLAEAAANIRDGDTAEAQGDVLEAPPSTWLLRPSAPDHGAPYSFTVTTPPGVAFVTGVTPLAGDAGAYGADVGDLEDAPYSVFGPLHVRTLDAKEPFVVFEPSTRKIGDDALVRWANRAASAVTAYYGRFPVPRLPVIVEPQEGGGVDHGKTLGAGGASIMVDVGEAVDQAMLDRDWVLTHEMVHTALPSLRRRYHWLEEGIATYVEPIGRAAVGIIPVEEVWKEMVEGMPQGEPANGDEGLDRTPTWGRTYWGGALFCLVADVRIREKTGNAKGLVDALRGVLEAGGSIYVAWDIEQVLDAGDRAIGVPVLRPLHDEMGSAPDPIDLQALWKRLGVVYANGAVTFDDTAPLAAARKVIVTPPPAR
jgi:hypothetical protein